ncbi:MAG: hypothetical protein ABIS39_05730 [Sphingomicrobium sp.]
MRDARKLLIPAVAAMALALPACQAEQQPDENQIITDINAAEPGDIEALPPDESVDLPPENADPRSPEERGDGDDMVNIVDDSGNRN